MTTRTTVLNVDRDTPGLRERIENHLSELRSAMVYALIIGLVVGALVFLIRYLWPDTYEVNGSALVSGTEGMARNSQLVNSPAAPYVELGQDDELLKAVAREAGVPTEEITEIVDVRANSDSRLVDIEVKWSSATQAKSIIEKLVSRIDAVYNERAGAVGEISGVNGRDASRIETEIDEAEQSGDSTRLAVLLREQQELGLNPNQQSSTVSSGLSLLAVNSGNGEPTSPKPLIESIIAGLIAAILAAEFIVLANGRLGSRVSPAWARQLRSTLMTDVDSGLTEGDALPLSTDIVRKRLLDNDSTLLILDYRLDPQPSVVVGDGDGDGDEETTSKLEDEAGDRLDDTKRELDDTDAAHEEPGEAEKNSPQLSGTVPSPIARSSTKLAARRVTRQAGPNPTAEDKSAVPVVADTDSVATDHGAKANSSAEPEPQPALAITSTVGPWGRGREMRTGLTGRWWESIPADDIDLALVVVDEDATAKADALECLERLALVDIPARIVVREVGSFTGPMGWIKI